jgi:hypothetical protein
MFAPRDQVLVPVQGLGSMAGAAGVEEVEGEISAHDARVADSLQSYH